MPVAVAAVVVVASVAVAELVVAVAESIAAVANEIKPKATPPPPTGLIFPAARILVEFYFLFLNCQLFSPIQRFSLLKFQLLREQRKANAFLLNPTQQKNTSRLSS